MRNLTLLIVAGLGLSACVTGMNSSVVADNNKTINQYPVETVLTTIFAQAHNEKLSAVINNQNAIAELIYIPKGHVLFNGKEVLATEVITTMSSDKQLIMKTVGTQYLSLSPFVIQGAKDEPNRYSKITQTTLAPRKAMVGDSGALATETLYSDSSKSEKIAIFNQTWSLEKDSNSTAWFCLNFSDNVFLENDPNSKSKECYKINAKGDILASKWIIETGSGLDLGTIIFTSK